MKLLLTALTAASLMLAGSPAPKGSTPMIRSEDQPGFLVAGYQVRTNNASEAKGQSAIGKLWQRLGDERFIEKIPHRTDNNITVVYSEYESNEKGDYDYLLGSRVDSAEDLPVGMTWRRVQPGRYAVIPTEIGQMPLVLQQAWRKVWRMKPDEMGGQRAFLTDYEVYDQRSIDPRHAQVDIHIGLKP